jgi:tetratricopeptide (TPR) repeat protein
MPDVTENYVAQGLSALANEEYPTAVDAFTKALRLSLGDLADIHYQRGLAYMGLNDEAQALEDWNESLRRNPYHAAAYYERGQLFEDKGNDEAAAQDYSRALTLDPRMVEAWFARGQLYERLGHLEAAEYDFSQVLRLEDDHVLAYECRGRIRAARRAYDGAIADLKEYLKRGGGQLYDNQSETQSHILSLRVTRVILRLLRLY